MDVLGLLLFAVKVFLHFFAWPLLALGYPLCASIKAIEANSGSDTQKLTTYWVVYSLVLLLEHTFAMLLQWFPYWPYIRLMIVFWLVMPDFNGASYLYKLLICSNRSFQIGTNLFNNRLEFSFDREKLLAEVERFVKENGTEALEKLISSKVNVNQEESSLVLIENELVGTEKTKETVAEMAVEREVVPQNEWNCNICNIALPNEKDFNSHIQGRKHKNKANAGAVKST